MQILMLKAVPFEASPFFPVVYALTCVCKM